MSLVFDDIERDLAGGMPADETHFAYLNRSNRFEAERVRGLIDAWLDDYPDAHRKGLISRLRSQTDEEHLSAVFELLLHALLRRTGHTILEIEPELDHTLNRPDFLVEGPDGTRFYLEAVTVTGKSKAEIGQEKLLSTAVRAIERTEARHHFLDLRKKGKPSQPITGKKLRRQLAAWIARLPIGDAAKDVAPFVYAEHGVTFSLKAFPRRHAAQPGDNPIGISYGEPVWVGAAADVRASLNHKATHYGALPLPLVVAVNVLSHNGDDALADALYGTVTTVARVFEDGHTELEDTRSPDGVWHGKSGPRKRGLSAVLAFSRIDAWNFGSRTGRLWRNPWSTNVLPPVPLRVAQRNPVDGEIVELQGETLATILGLPAAWPED